MADCASLVPSEAADRLAIRELFDTYAHCADRRDAEEQKALFTVDTRFAGFMGGEGAEPTYVVEDREAGHRCPQWRPCSRRELHDCASSLHL